MDRPTFEQMQILRSRITEIVNASDPIGMLRLGAPSDEYESEVDEILEAYLRVGPRTEALTAVIQDTFDSAFGPLTVPAARSKFIAARLCEVLPTAATEHGK